MSDLIVAIKAQVDEFKRSVGQMGDNLDDFSQKGGRAISFVSDNWKQMTLAGAAAGAALEGFARTQAETNATLARTAIVTGETEAALRDSISAMVDHTFSAHDAARAMDDLISRGITTRQEFEQILPAADTLADALGIDIVTAIDTADRALSALGIPLTEMEEHMDTITFISQRTTVEMGNLGMAFRREAPAMREMGLSFDDVAIAMAALEAEGRRGPRAVMGFQTAIKEAGGDVNAFWHELGVSTETLQQQQQALIDSTGLTEAFAEANNAQMTPLERLQANLSNLLFQYGDLAQALGAVAPLLIAIGPATKGVIMVFQTLIPVLKAVFALMMANPFTLIIAGLAAIGVALYVLIDDWSAVTDAIGRAWDFIVNVTEDARRAVVDAVSRMMDTAIQMFNSFMSTSQDIFRSIGQFIFGVFESLFPSVAGKIREMVQTGISLFTDLRDRAVQIVTDLLNGVVERIQSMFSWVTDTIGRMGSFISGIFGRTKEEVADVTVPEMTTKVVRDFTAMSDQVKDVTEDMSETVGWTMLGLNQDVTENTSVMVDDTVANWNRMRSNVTNITVGMGRTVTGLQRDMTKNWESVTVDMVDDTIVHHETMSDRIQSILGDMSTNNLDIFGSFSSSWLGGVDNLVSQTLSQFTNMSSGITGILGSLFGGGGGGTTQAIGGEIGSAIGGPIGGAIGSIAGRAVRSIGRAFGFAQGGLVTGPVNAIIGEGHDHELVTPLPRFEAMMDRSFSAGQQSDGGQPGVASEVRALRQSFETMTAELVYNSSRLLKIEQEWDRNGLPESRDDRLAGSLQ